MDSCDLPLLHKASHSHKKGMFYPLFIFKTVPNLKSKTLTFLSKQNQLSFQLCDWLTRTESVLHVPCGLSLLDSSELPSSIAPLPTLLVPLSSLVSHLKRCKSQTVFFFFNEMIKVDNRGLVWFFDVLL